MDQENQTPHKRRGRYKGKYPIKFEEKYNLDKNRHISLLGGRR